MTAVSAATMQGKCRSLIDVTCDRNTDGTLIYAQAREAQAGMHPFAVSDLPDLTPKGKLWLIKQMPKA